MAQKHSIKIRRTTTLGGLCLALIAFPGCSESGPDDTDVATIADMEMRAITLREARFALANEIRYTQDTLLRTDSTAPEAAALNERLQAMAVRKDSLTKASLALADTIKRSLSTIIDPKRYSQEERAEFNERLNEELKRRNGGALPSSGEDG